MTAFQLIYPMQNSIQEYAWGSTTAIAELMGQPSPSDTPQAELWMGAHPKAPSQILFDGSWQALDGVIDANPELFLGADTARRFHNRLPFLFKVLAAAAPLSVQAHPNSEQARDGFDAENRAGIPLDAFDRNYRDASHKPEIICALAPFWGLNGFRSREEIGSLLNRYIPDPGRLVPGIGPLLETGGLKDLYRAVMSLPAEARRQVVSQCVEIAAGAADHLETWILRLHEAYSDDIGVVSPLLLNLVCLSPGEAMFLPAGQLHAYLEGVGVELMANSDNVLRGGLTPKHVDVDELLRVLDFTETHLEIMPPAISAAGEHLYPTNAEEFQLSTIRIEHDAEYRNTASRTVEILLFTNGTAEIDTGGGAESLSIVSGHSILVPAATTDYTIRGTGTIFRAVVPIDTSGSRVTI